MVEKAPDRKIQYLGFVCSLSDDGTVRIDEYTGSEKELNIPREINGYRVTSINEMVFAKCSFLVSVTVPDSVTSIGTGAFSECCSLTSVNSLGSITSIPDFLFRNCECLKEVAVPDNVTSFGDSAFKGCISLKTVTIPDGVVSIGSGAFSHCKSLPKIMIPDSVTYIDRGAFFGCDSLTVIVNKGSHAEWFCEKTKTRYSIAGLPQDNDVHDYEYTVSDKNGTAAITKYKGNSANLTIPAYIDGYRVIMIGDEAFAACKSLVSVFMPEGLMILGNCAFEECDSLVSVSIPSSVQQIGVNPFSQCSKLQEINVSPLNPCLLSMEGMLVERESRNLVAYTGGSAARSVTVLSGINSIGTYAFSGSSSLETLVIPEGVVSIGIDAFSFCTSLTRIVIPGSVAQISGAPFAACLNLREIVISPQNSHFICIDGILYEKTKGALITAPKATVLTEYSFPRGLISIARCAFYGSSLVTSVELPSTVTSIGEWAFGICSALKSVRIPASVTSIGENAFKSDNALTVIVDRNSYAERYCEANGIRYSYSNTIDWMSEFDKYFK